jgi:uncharacterized protein (TIGR00369 family)
MPDSKEFQALKALLDGTPYLKFLGIELTDAGEGWVKMKMPFREEFLQPTTVHGGAIYSLADTAATQALMTLIYPQEWATTVEQRINFLRAPRRNDLYCEAHVVHAGKTLAYTEVSVTLVDGTLVARSTATQMRLEPKRWAGK